MHSGDNNTRLPARRKNGMRSRVGHSGSWQETDLDGILDDVWHEKHSTQPMAQFGLRKW